MKLDNKGMAISGILYSILVLFIVLVFGVLSVLASTKFSFDKFKKDIMQKLSSNEIQNAVWSYEDNDYNGRVNIGDEIKIGTESFYIISNDGNTTKAIAKYNLYVGGEYNGTSWTEYGDNATGLQDKSMKGYVKNESKRYGTTPFSSDSIKGINYSDYSGSIVERYVNNYKIKLEEMGVNLVDASLITEDELYRLGCDSSIDVGKCSNDHDFIYSTSYWTKTEVPEEPTRIFSVYSDNSFDCDGDIYNVNKEVGVRPVITILTNDISESIKKNIDVDVYVESALHGAIPQLDNGMIPVTIDNDGSVKKADLYSEWYKYDDENSSNDNSKWANAILVTDESRDEYKNASANYPIKTEDIKAYLVWIPRYKYAIPSVSDKNNPPLINIVFENKDESKSNGTAVGKDYYTHPAFTFDNKELNGIWVGKFETTGAANTPTVLPNVASLTSQSISDEFTTAKRFKNYGIFGDSHMMKNSEWGAVAYLSHSRYGSNHQIRINNYYNDNKTLTGCGANTDSANISTTCDIQYASTTLYPQSTTNNITGIFDMSGGAYEKVMGNYKNTLSSSGFTQMPESKYYDLFNGDTYETACNNGLCKGHASYETNGWYSDIYHLISSSNSWICRGGDYVDVSTAGIFNIDYSSGYANTYSSFRLVVSNVA